MNNQKLADFVGSLAETLDDLAGSCLLVAMVIGLCLWKRCGFRKALDAIDLSFG